MHSFWAAHFSCLIVCGKWMDFASRKPDIYFFAVIQQKLHVDSVCMLKPILGIAHSIFECLIKLRTEQLDCVCRFMFKPASGPILLSEMSEMFSDWGRKAANAKRTLKPSTTDSFLYDNCHCWTATYYKREMCLVSGCTCYVQLCYTTMATFWQPMDVWHCSNI